MNARARVIAQIKHQETRPLPYTLGWEAGVLGYRGVEERLDEHYGSPRWKTLLDSSIRRLPNPNAGVAAYDGVHPYDTDVFGTRWQVDRRPFHLVEPALKEPTLAGYRFPDLDKLLTTQWRADMAQAIADSQALSEPHFIVAGFGFGLFERTWALRGFSEVLMDAASEPDFYDALVQAIADHQMAVIEELLKLPVDGIMFSDDWGYQRGVLLGPERWRKFIKPRLAKMYARVHTAGKYTLSHCCGSVSDILEDIIEIGLDVLESVQPEAMNPYELKYKYGRAITFWGGLGSQSIVPLGTPEAIKTEVRKLAREMGRGGGYILGLAKALQAETPTENAAAVVEAFLEQACIRFP